MPSLPTSHCAYRVTYPNAAQETCESSWGHTLIFRTVPSANTLVRWVDENAFASIVQTRPCPTFGRPVHQWDSSLDYGPVLLLKPFRSYLTVGTLPSDTIFGQRGITPTFGYGSPHLRARGTLTLLIHALPSAHYKLVRPCAPHRYSHSYGSST